MTKKIIITAQAACATPGRGIKFLPANGSKTEICLPKVGTFGFRFVREIACNSA